MNVCCSFVKQVLVQLFFNACYQIRKTNQLMEGIANATNRVSVLFC